MSDILFENLNKPSGSFPYISLDVKNLEYIAHYHEEFEIVLVNSGTAIVMADMNDIVLNAGDICIIMPGQIHSFKRSWQNNLLLLKIDPKNHVEKVRFECLRLANCKIAPTDRYYSDFRKLIDGISKEYSQRNEGFEFAIRAYKNLLITNILRKTEHCTVNSNKHLQLINEVNSFIEQNYSQPITLDDAAVKMRLSKYYFAHSFKELMGMSFMTYLCYFRLERAKQLLANSRKSVTDIALECGFGNVRSFNRMFRKQTGLSPTEYRKSI